MEGLIESLKRANENMTGATKYWVDGDWQMGAFQLAQLLDTEGQKMVRSYARMYLKACGWAVRSVQFTGSAVIIKFRNEVIAEAGKHRQACLKIRKPTNSGS